MDCLLRSLNPAMCWLPRGQIKRWAAVCFLSPAVRCCWQAAAWASRNQSVRVCLGTSHTPLFAAIDGITTLSRISFKVVQLSSFTKGDFHLIFSLENQEAWQDFSIVTQSSLCEDGRKNSLTTVPQPPTGDGAIFGSSAVQNSGVSLRFVPPRTGWMRSGSPPCEAEKMGTALLQQGGSQCPWSPLPPNWRG